ncbi:hypothetical protein [Rheinheimera sp. 1928-s]|uniref:hypothetical protein n=2 Tax=Rheinheimera TaxID=67575 RepID=UPI00261F364A|nr:hypothetical protein [Rheinheimera sp. 1928-s]MDF3124475.1 hypothetical protein [Rheinheimera sp. 1928-s]
MAKQLKKASLLSEADKQKLLKKAGNKKPLTQAQTTTTAIPAARTVTRSATRSNNEEQTSTSTAKSFKVWAGISMVLLVAFILAPKPQLIEYQSAGLTTQSVYMPGWFGKPGVILDTNQRAVLAEEEQSLYLCFEGQSNEQCAKYRLRKQQGFIAAAIFWYSSRP